MRKKTSNAVVAVWSWFMVEMMVARLNGALGGLPIRSGRQTNFAQIQTQKIGYRILLHDNILDKFDEVKFCNGQ